MASAFPSPMMILKRRICLPSVSLFASITGISEGNGLMARKFNYVRRLAKEVNNLPCAD